MDRSSLSGIWIDEFKERRYLLVVVATDLQNEEIAGVRVHGDQHGEMLEVGYDAPLIRGRQILNQGKFLTQMLLCDFGADRHLC